MHAVRRPWRNWLATGTVATAIALLPGTAAADWPPTDSQGGQTTGTRQGQALESKVSFSGSTNGSGGNKGKGFVAANNWTPPACWYEPRSPAEFQAAVEAFYNDTVNYPGQHSYAKTAVGQYRDIYKNGKYKNYNLDKAGQGAFWVAAYDPARRNDPAASACSDLPEWVPNGTPPPFRQAITPQILAEAAYSRISIPDSEVSLAPAANTKVNLPTWAWLDKGVFKPVSVTATLDAGGTTLSATVTATPQSMRLKPGTQDATLHPGSGECTINDGSIGAPFAAGSESQTPPCGVTYLRSSGSGTYPLQATVTWAVSWTSTNNAAPTQLPPGTFEGEPQNVTVQEIQAVTR
ncbi:hypothetical protein ACIPYQ_05655 [Streptomyces sp. NPDC090045]|uniref:hypothetical protein n=1 Tax=Streptomyces sp. NPDC090045 TaxID=3365927 RepID=UPI00381B3308